MIPVPAALRERAAAAFGKAGIRWCEALPGVFAEYRDAWGLTLDLPHGVEPWHGFCGIVVPVVTSRGEQAVLKISWADEETAHEHTALAAWRGIGAVRLLAADGPRRVLLLERLDGGHDLRAVPVTDAIGVWADDALLDRAVGLARELSTASGGGPLIHADLHYENVLATLPGAAAQRGSWAGSPTYCFDLEPIHNVPRCGLAQRGSQVLSRGAGR